MADQNLQPRYTAIIQWSDEDQCYVVSLPEWGPYCKAQGNSYEEAAKNAREVLELLMEPDPTKLSPPAPAPKYFNYPGADVVNLPPSAVGPQPLREKRKTA